MTIAQMALAEASIAQADGSGSGTAKKAPPKRTAQAVADQKLVPEPR